MEPQDTQRPPVPHNPRPFSHLPRLPPGSLAGAAHMHVCCSNTRVWSQGLPPQQHPCTKPRHQPGNKQGAKHQPDLHQADQKADRATQHHHQLHQALRTSSSPQSSFQYNAGSLRVSAALTSTAYQRLCLLSVHLHHTVQHPLLLDELGAAGLQDLSLSGSPPLADNSSAALAAALGRMTSLLELQVSPAHSL
jgi:hypothetical protein